MSRRNERAGTAVVLGLLFLPLTTTLYGATLAKLWEWFIADTFGVLALSTAEAVGVSLVVTFVTYQYDAVNRDDDADPLEKLGHTIGFGVFRAVFCLAFGAIVKGFIG